MSTDTTQLKPRKKRPLKRYIVTRDGMPCARSTNHALGINIPGLVPLRGILTPTTGEPEIFKGEKSANRAIMFTLRLRKKLSDAVFSIPPSIQPFMAGKNFAVVKTASQVR